MRQLEDYCCEDCRHFYLYGDGIGYCHLHNVLLGKDEMDACTTGIIEETEREQLSL